MKDCKTDAYVKNQSPSNNKRSSSFILISILLISFGVVIVVARGQPLQQPQRARPSRVIFPGPVVTDQRARSATVSQSTTIQPPDLTSGANLGSNSCASRATCKGQASRAKGAPMNWEKLPCRCDKSCRLYDDCCRDSEWAESIEARKEERLDGDGKSFRMRRNEWTCKPIIKQDDEAARVMVRVKCHPNWPKSEQTVRQRCESIAGRVNQSDPLGSIMPITDLSTGITYANSYCLRCNFLAKDLSSAPNQRDKSSLKSLVYWSPKIICLYNRATDVRNTLIDLVSTNPKRVLKYSSQRNNWLIEEMVNQQQKNNSNERVCQILAVPPEAAEHSIRYCKKILIDQCPAVATNSGERLTKELEKARFECHFGHQMLTYSSSRLAVYYNAACARCHQVLPAPCEEPKTSFGIMSVPTDDEEDLPTYKIGIFHISSFNESTATGQQRLAPTSFEDLGRSTDVGSSGDQQTGSFSVLMDLYGAFHNAADQDGADGGGGNTESGGNRGAGGGVGSGGSSSATGAVGAVHRCEDADRQVYDPFLLTCRDIVCGLNLRFVDGSCVEDTHRQQQQSGGEQEKLQEKFNDKTTNDRPTKGVPPTASLSNSTSNATSVQLEVANSTTVASLTASVATISPPPSPSEHTELASDSGDVGGSANTTATTTGVTIGNSSELATTTTPMGFAKSSTFPTHLTTAGASNSASSSTNETSTGQHQVVLQEKDTVKIAQDATTLPKKEKLITIESHQQQQARAISLVNSSTRNSSKLFSSQNYSETLLAKTLHDLQHRFASKLATISTSPSLIEKSRRHFAECGKILIEPEHYQLFTIEQLLVSIKSLNRSAEDESSAILNNSISTNEQLESMKDLVWALVMPYNLILGPSEFELVRLNGKVPMNGGEQQQDFNLLVCSPFKSDLVNKFHPAMAYLTTCCLIISIASLLLYLLLYFISTFDLRSLLVEMTQAANKSESNGSSTSGNNVRSETGWSFWSWCIASPLDGQFRGSRASNEAFQTTRSQTSLSSRGVACLSAALLAAYLLFIIGHKQRQINGSEETSTNGTCALIATGTYYFFLLAFSWMFLLSYDIWRTLSLATSCLRLPATHSQSKRFLIYAICAFSFAAIVSLVAFTLDQLNFDQHSCLRMANLAPSTQQSGQGSTFSLADGSELTCTNLRINFERFLFQYRPKFGQRPGSCWFSNKRSLALFFGLPVTLIMLVNLAFFLHSSCMVLRTSSRSKRRPPASQTISNSTILTLVPQASLTNRSSTAAVAAPTATATTTTITLNLGPNVEQLINRNSKQPMILLDFTQQNSLTTSSFASVQTVQSNLDSELAANSFEILATASRRASMDSLSMSNNSSLERQYSSDSGNHSATSSAEACRPSSASRQQSLASMVNKIGDKPIGDLNVKDLPTISDQKSHSTTPIGSKASKSATSRANLLFEKCDFQMHHLSSLVGSLIKDYRLYCRLSTIMGLTWLTGLIASMVDQSDVLWYLFVVLNTLQGLFIFIAFGLKRSKLINLSILLCYISFKLRQLLVGWRARNYIKQQESARETSNN